MLRDRTLGLEMESSNFAAYFAADLAAEFSKSRFILTVRDCRSWLESFISLQLALNARPRSLVFDEFRRLRFNRLNWIRPSEERALEAAGLSPIRGYPSYWREHVKMVVDHVPKEGLLVVRTDQISDRISQIADSLEIDENSIFRSKAESNVSTGRSTICAELDPDFLRRAIRDCCSDLMAEYFPEVSLEGC